MARTTCGNSNCPGPSNVLAIYSHNCTTGTTKKWSKPADGPTPTSTPHPDPCPDDSVSCQPITAICATCGWVQP